MRHFFIKFIILQSRGSLVCLDGLPSILSLDKGSTFTEEVSLLNFSNAGPGRAEQSRAGMSQPMLDKPEPGRAQPGRAGLGDRGGIWFKLGLWGGDTPAEYGDILFRDVLLELRSIRPGRAGLAFSEFSL